MAYDLQLMKAPFPMTAIKLPEGTIDMRAVQLRRSRQKATPPIDVTLLGMTIEASEAKPLNVCCECESISRVEQAMRKY